MQVQVRGINSGRDTESSVALVIDGIVVTNPNALNQEMDNMENMRSRPPRSDLWKKRSRRCYSFKHKKTPEEFGKF